MGRVLYIELLANGDPDTSITLRCDSDNPGGFSVASWDDIPIYTGRVRGEETSLFQRFLALRFFNTCPPRRLLSLLASGIGVLTSGRVPGNTVSGDPAPNDHA